ncbi:hypothetical protein JY97_04545 [Alkalispirochaeta odontotermitis]|nr:hypothetical protein JY97_04545 [Alkalispirochaeta odontotermitis]
MVWAVYMGAAAVRERVHLRILCCRGHSSDLRFAYSDSDEHGFDIEKTKHRILQGSESALKGKQIVEAHGWKL